MFAEENPTGLVTKNNFKYGILQNYGLLFTRTVSSSKFSVRSSFIKSEKP